LKDVGCICLAESRGKWTVLVTVSIMDAAYKGRKGAENLLKNISTHYITLMLLHIQVGATYKKNKSNFKPTFLPLKKQKHAYETTLLSAYPPQTTFECLNQLS
jgi:hypothetical protein